MTLLKKEEIKTMMKLKGNVKGIILKGHFDYVKDMEGEKGVKNVEKELENLGYPIKLREVDALKWYPEALACLFIITCADIFGWREKEIFEMAYQSPKYSFFVKLLMQHFVKIEKTFQAAPSYWRKHFDFSEMEVSGFDEKEKHGIIRLINFHKYHPLICEYHRGYFCKVAEIMLGQRKVKVEHTKCLFKKDPCEEFKISWD